MSNIPRDENKSILTSPLDQVLQKQASGRMSIVLPSLAQKNFGGESLFRLLSRRELANFAGISTLDDVQVLKVFVNDGLTRLLYRSIRILNCQRLEKISWKE